MGCWDIYCSLCGLPLNTGEFDNIKLPKWLRRCTLLLNNNKNVSNAKEVSCNVDFVTKNNSYYGVFRPYLFIAIHTDCLKFINSEKKIKLRYSDFPINSKLYNQTNSTKSFVFNIDYKPISKYWAQIFDIEQYIADGHSLETPLKNNRTSKFIINIFNKLKIKTDRVGPRVSATLYDDNDLLIGSDNNIWCINKNKWTKLNDLETYNFATNIDITKKNIQILNDVYKFFEYNYIDDRRYNQFVLFSIPRIGQVSKYGLLMKDIKIKITKKMFNIRITILHTKNNTVLNNMIKNNFGLL